MASGVLGRQPKNIVEFRAGKMNQVGNMVNPDSRKGLVYVFQSEDGLTHFCWKDRKTGTLEDDLIVFPEDCEYKKVTQCKEGSRVYLLKFKASAKKLFFWMQEPKADADDDYVWKVNDALNNPGGSSGRAASGNVTPSASEQEMQNLLGSMSQTQLMQLLGGMSEAPGLLAQLNQLAPGLANLGGGGSSANSDGTATETASGGGSTGSGGPKPQSLLKVKKTTTPVAPKTTSSSAHAPIQLEDLQSILNRIQPPPAGGVQVDLTAGVNSEAIRRITSCPNTVKKLAPLLPQFGGASAEPEGEGTAQEVEETLKSPQFQSALQAFCAAFPTGQLGPLIAQFGFSADAITAAQNGNLEGFINAIQTETDTLAAAPTSSDVIEDMNVD